MAMTDAPSPSLTTSTVRGAAWNYGVFASSKFAAFAGSVVLAHLLAPRDFGLLALSLLALTYVDVLNEFGVSAGVIYTQGDVDRNSSVAFMLSCLTGVLAFAVVAGFASPLSHFFREPHLVQILRVMAIAFILSSLGSIHEARLRRRLAFRQRLIPELIRSGSKAIVSIALALFGFGVWSLVWGQLISTAVASISYWRMEPWRPTLIWDRQIATKLTKYGLGFMGATLLGTVLKDVDYLVIGRQLNAKRLGFYSIGYRLPELAVMGATYAFSQTIFPVFARLRDDREKLNRAYLKTVRTLALVTMPIGVGIAIVSNDFVRVFYGTRWGPTAGVMPYIALATVVTAASFVTGDIYKATGRLSILNLIGLIRLPVALAALLFAVHYDIHGVAIAQLVLSLFALAVQLFAAQRFLGLRANQLFRELVPAFASCLIMVCASAAMAWLLSPLAGTWARLLVVSLTGGLAYLAALSLLFRSAVIDVLAAFRKQAAA